MKRLLQNGEWLPVAYADKPTIDGRTISKSVINQILESFKKINHVPYIALGHDGYFDGGREARIGSITDIRFNDTTSTLEILPSNLDNEVMKEIEQGKYPHLSIELGIRTETTEIPDGDCEKIENYYYMLDGVAILGRVPAAFPDFKTVQFSKNNDKTSNKLSKSIFICENLFTKGVNMENKETPPITNQQPELFQANSQSVVDGNRKPDKLEMNINTLTEQIEVLKSQIDITERQYAASKTENEKLKSTINQYVNEISQLTFKAFYEEGIKEGWLYNNDLEYKENSKDIYKSSLFDRWQTYTVEQREQLKYMFKQRVPKINMSIPQIKFGRETIKEEAYQSDEDKLLKIMSDLASKDGQNISTTNYHHYLTQANLLMNGGK